MKFKERFAKWNKSFFSQYDIVDMMNLNDFEFKDFIINVKTKSISHKNMNPWFFSQAFDDKKLISEFMFFYYQHNFYPRGGWLSEWRGNYAWFKAVKDNLEQALLKTNKPK